ncbi:MAG: hypothetical protein A2427_01075 [Candidatus Nealsonbacteria bacterium RIFOXYC1_FULL_40_7]|uniref:Formyl transferase N-terminal domain-containing protein n=1 Tax=Candidatus Nealsonbacteria bacterium RIFOXYC1_FULL_40_7 TaxID=1801678 RepID=A0A1G2ENC4_9BACT|nr:MAG: hypothetical protein A2427_01075 [Candidatus Nealsonbacteria bacterium RIFOXYC1_FULL_40_7]
MKVLFLTNNKESLILADWLVRIAGETVIAFGNELTIEYLKGVKPDFIVSYNYKHLIRENILKILRSNRIINLHISYLPYNRGSNPNFWSIVEQTPCGVTIHRVDQGLDTGPILSQIRITFPDESITLAESYQILHRGIQRLFKQKWLDIKQNNLRARIQPKGGTKHTIKDFERVKITVLSKGWNTSIGEARKNYNKFLLSSNLLYPRKV